MPQRFPLVIFDWDGTLMDSTGLIARSLQAACGDLGLPIPSEDKAKHIIGLGLGDALRYAVPKLEPSGYRALAERYRKHFLAEDQNLPLFPGVHQALESLRDMGFTLAVATGKSRSGLRRAMESTGLANFFEASRCADETFPKPHPAMLEELLDELAMKVEDAVMVGDTTHDLQLAANAGMAALAVCYGAHPRSALEQHSPLGYFEDFSSLAAWLRTHG